MSTKKKYNVLFIEGAGALLGYKLKVLEFLEYRSCSKTADIFDFISSTSSGSFASMLCVKGANISPIEISRKAMVCCDEVYKNRNGWLDLFTLDYNNLDGCMQFLDQYQNITLADLKTDFSSVTAVPSPEQGIYYSSIKAKLSEDENINLKDMIASSIAIPLLNNGHKFFFKGEEKTGLDGGVFFGDNILFKSIEDIVRLKGISLDDMRILDMPMHYGYDDLQDFFDSATALNFMRNINNIFKLILLENRNTHSEFLQFLLGEENYKSININIPDFKNYLLKFLEEEVGICEYINHTNRFVLNNSQELDRLLTKFLGIEIKSSCKTEYFDKAIEQNLYIYEKCQKLGIEMDEFYINKLSPFNNLHIGFDDVKDFKYTPELERVFSIYDSIEKYTNIYSVSEDSKILFSSSHSGIVEKNKFIETADTQNAIGSRKLNNKFEMRELFEKAYPSYKFSMLRDIEHDEIRSLLGDEKNKSFVIKPVLGVNSRGIKFFSDFNDFEARLSESQNDIKKSEVSYMKNFLEQDGNNYLMIEEFIPNMGQLYVNAFYNTGGDPVIVGISELQQENINGEYVFKATIIDKSALKAYVPYVMDFLNSPTMKSLQFKAFPFNVQFAITEEKGELFPIEFNPYRFSGRSTEGYNIVFNIHQVKSFYEDTKVDFLDVINRLEYNYYELMVNTDQKEKVKADCSKEILNYFAEWLFASTFYDVEKVPHYEREYLYAKIVLRYDPEKQREVVSRIEDFYKEVMYAPCCLGGVEQNLEHSEL